MGASAWAAGYTRTLNENLKKVNAGYNEYKILSDKVDHIKSLKDVKEIENKVIKNNKENIVDSHININIQSSEKDEIPEMVINKEKDLNKSLKKENVNKNIKDEYERTIEYLKKN